MQTTLRHDEFLMSMIDSAAPQIKATVVIDNGGEHPGVWLGRVALRTVTVMLVALCVALGAAAAVSPGTLAKSAIAAMRAQRSYHYVTHQVQPSNGGAHVTMVGDASPTEGIQRITFSKGSHSGHVTVLVTANTAYIRGDAFTLMNYMGFPATAAATYSGKWLSLAQTAPDFHTVAADVRLDNSALENLKMPPSVRVVDSNVLRGQHVTGLRATVHHTGLTGLETLYVRATGTPLPVELTVTRNGRLVVDVWFGGWGEPVHVSAPGSAMSLP